MSTRITFLFADPADPEAFERDYADGYLDLVRALPGIERVESARVWPKEDGTPRPAHRVVDAWFAGYDAACAAMTTPAAAALFPRTFAMGTGGVTVLFSEVDADG